MWRFTNMNIKLDLVLVLSIFDAVLTVQNSGFNCSNCLYGGDFCDPSTFKCTYGCKPGWKGTQCTETCKTEKCEECIATQLYSDSYETCTRCQDPGVYGPQCRSFCSFNCLGRDNDRCDDFGNCLYGCKPPYIGAKCDDQMCDIPICHRCSIGIYGELRCDQCYSGNFWQSEQNECLPCSQDTCAECEENTGICTQCKPGYYGNNCNLVCSINKCAMCNSNGTCASCVNGMFPDQSGTICISCSSKNCFRDLCSTETGLCLYGCKDGWYNDSNECKPCDKLVSNCGKCSDNCANGCDFATGYCVGECKFGFYGDMCQNQCSKQCYGGCHRNNGTCIGGCTSGFFGTNCQNTCKPHCMNGVCSFSDGFCECGQSWKGDNCDILCNPNCFGGDCIVSTNLCMSGCAAGWYGTTCGFICSSGCEDRVCHNNGSCVGDCIIGFYDRECSRRCSANCNLNQCDKSTGKCVFGCTQGFYGDRCSDRCPTFCLDGSCDMETGVCFKCTSGKRGDTCEEVETGTTDVNLYVLIGSSVGGTIVFCVLTIAVVCLIKHQRKRKSMGEPMVIYRDSEVTIRRASDSNTLSESTESSSSVSKLFKRRSSKQKIYLRNELRKNGKTTLFQGQIITKSGRKKHCVIKVVKLTELAINKGELNRLVEETKIHSLCHSHINVVTVLAPYHNKDVYCVAMEKCVESGLVPFLQNLSSANEDGFQESDNLRLVQFAIDTCSALCHIHTLKVIHRMMMAHHVYVNSNLVAKVGDFYWAAILPDNIDFLTIRTNELPPDSYPWQSPEAKDSNRFSFYSDVWSLGMLFWEIFSYGKRPFEDKDQYEYSQVISEGLRPGKPVSAHNTIYRIMKNCWRYSSHDRPSAETVRQQLLGIQGRFSDVNGVCVDV